MAASSNILKGRVLLVVEDSDDMWRLAEMHLKNVGAQPQRAINGAEAVKMATVTTYDAILMDVQMPVMDGLEATRLLRARGILVPILAITTNSFSEHSAESIRAGCTEHIAKPVDVDLLIHKLAEYCDTNDINVTIGLG